MKRVANKIGLYLVLSLFLVFLLFPFYWMAVTSLKIDKELYDLSTNPLFIKQGLTLQHYVYLFKKTSFLTWFKNTFIIAFLVTIITLTVSAPAAYSVTRFKFRGRTTFAIAVFISYLIPPTLLFIPLYKVLKLLRLIDTIWSMVVTYPTFTMPFCTWLLMGYFKTIPRELEESALVDGANRLQVLLRIVCPVALPGLTTVTLFSFTLSWMQFLYPVAFISASTQKPLSVGVVSELVRGDVFYWGSLMAGALLASLPVILVYMIFTRYFISGLTAGATKY